MYHFISVGNIKIRNMFLITLKRQQRQNEKLDDKWAY